MSIVYREITWFFGKKLLWELEKIKKGTKVVGVVVIKVGVKENINNERTGQMITLSMTTNQVP